MRAPVLALPAILVLLSCTSYEARPKPTAPASPGPASAPSTPRPPPVVRAALSAFDAEVERRRAAFASEARRLSGWRRDRARLEHLVDLDQYVRSYPQADIVVRFDDEERLAFDDAFAPRWRKIDESNTAELKRLLDEHGWFTRTAFGPRADRNAWLLVQHADHDAAFQREILDRLAPLVDQGETDPKNHAYLHDRVAVAEGHPQRFGTQGRCVAPGRWAPYPIEDEERVDARREEAGMGRLEEYARRMGEWCE